MSKLAGTKTEKNLMDAFAGESMARTKYDFYASKAKKDGYVQISEIFEETANNEKEHAKMWFKLVHGIGKTMENLESAAQGERYEWTEMYANFAKEAREEGFEDIAKLFDGVAKIEKDHDERYTTLVNNIKEGKVFKRDTKEVWICLNCGHIHEGEEAPEMCPVCVHSKAYFQLRVIDY